MCPKRASTGRRRLRAPARQARIAIGSVANEREIVRNRQGGTPNFCATPLSSRIARVRAVQLHDAVPPRTHWARSLSGVQITTRPTRGSAAASARRRRQRIVGFELDHRPDDDPHRDECAFQNRELRPEAPDRCLRSSCSPATSSLRNDSMTRSVATPRCVTPRLVMPRIDASTPRTAATSRPWSSLSDGSA